MKIPASVRAIDVHVHPNDDEAIAAGGEYLAWAHRHFKKDVQRPTVFGGRQTKIMLDNAVTLFNLDRGGPSPIQA